MLSAVTGRFSKLFSWAGLAFFLAGGAFFMSRGLGLLPRPDQDQTPQVAVDYAERGESFLHAVPLASDLHMNLPMSTVWAALAFDHWALSARTYGTAVLAALLVLLVLACLACDPSSAWPCAAASLLLALCLSPDLLIYPQFEYSCLVLLTAGLLVWRSRTPTFVRTLAFSLAVGGGLLFRSPLAFFPPLLALGEWVWSRTRAGSKSGLKPYWKHGLILCTVPYVFLIPWIWLNWTSRHQLIVLEGGQASTNVVAGALGLTQTIEGDWTLLVDPALDAGDPAEVMAWALKQVAGQPLRYVESCFRRIHLCLSQFPVLWFLALAAWWRFRRDPGALRLGLMAGYFVLIHCTMAVDLRYLSPVWAILALLAARLTELPGRTPASRACSRLGSGGLLAGLAAVLCLAVFTSAKVLAVASVSGASAGELGARLAGDLSKDAWVHASLASDRLLDGDPVAAGQALEKAASLRPDRQDYSLRLAWARGLADGKGFPLDWQLPATVVDYRLKMAFHLYRGHAMLLRKDREAGLGELSEARRIFEATVWVHGAPAEREDLLEEMLVGRDRRFGGAAMEAMAGLKPRPRYDFCRELAKAAPSVLPRCLAIIPELAQSEPRFAAEALARADAPSLAPAERHRLALLRQRLGDYKGAVSILRELSRKEPGEGVYFSDLGVNEFLAGSPAEAVSHLEKAIELCPDRLAAYASLGAIYSRQGRKEAALEVYDRALSIKGPVRDPRVREDILQARALVR